MGKVREKAGAHLYSHFDLSFMAIYRRIFIRHPFLTLCVSCFSYAALMLACGRYFGVSANFFVVVPVTVAALTYGFGGGLAAGSLGLPANLLVFAFLGHPDFSPASKALAEASGIVLGGTLGYLSDLSRRSSEEIVLRRAIEESLRTALREKEAMYREVHHRIKNNLNVVKSLIRLQCNESDDPEFRTACEKLEQRIYSIAIIHERLYRRPGLPSINAGDYIRSLVGNITAVNTKPGLHIDIVVDTDGIELAADTAVPLGLIVNEVATNAFKYAFEGKESPRLEISFRRKGPRLRLEIADNGPGLLASEESAGLGMRLVGALVRQLRGQLEIDCVGGTRFMLEFPASENGDDPTTPEA